MKQSIELKPKRPTLLSIWLVFMVIANLTSFLTNLLQITSVIHQKTYSNWHTLILMTASIFLISSAILLWKWKKLGLYIPIIAGILITAVFLSVSQSVIVVIAPLIATAVNIAVLYLMMKPVWSRFS
jgi:hypothetical protein